MRLTCPNCGAQYEVPDDAIPAQGRDVQCSNCGNTWFQPGKQAKADPEDQGAPASGRKLAPEIADILRQEAEHEARLRAAEAAAPLESQPDLGLDQMDTHDAQRPVPMPEAAPVPASASASERKSVEAAVAAAVTSAATAPPPRPRRAKLPDIEEINSTLRSTGDRAAERAPIEDLSRPAGRQSRGFLRGFTISISVVVVLVLIYANAPRIAQMVPQSDPALSAFVALVDQARLWLDNQIRAAVP